MGSASHHIGRAIITDDDVTGFRAEFRAERSLLMAAFLAMWLGGWSIGEFVVLSRLAGLMGVPVPRAVRATPAPVDARKAGRPQTGWEELVIFSVWLPFWTAAGLNVAHALLWHVSGRETILIDEDFLLVRHETALIGRGRTFRLSQLRELRYAPDRTPPIGALPVGVMLPDQHLLGMVGDSVAFEHDGRTYGLGAGLSHPEAEQLIALLRERLRMVQDEPGTDAKGTALPDMGLG